MRSFPRLLAAGVVALGAASLLGACAAPTPTAATVNGQSINQTAVDSELASLSANRSYIAAIDTANAQQGVRIEGPSNGTYNSAWTAHVLTGQIEASAVDQYLARGRQLPSQHEVMVARAVEAANYQQYWNRFSATYRLTLAARTADLALLPTPTVPAAELKAVYTRFKPYFFSEMCVRQAVFASRSAAEAFATTPRGAGSVTCYTPAQFESQPDSFTAAVISLTRGRASAPRRTPGGFAVDVVTTRRTIPLDGAMRRTLAVVVGANSGDPALERLLARDHVRVDPMYGKWRGSARSGFAVAPPSQPGQG